MKSKLIVIIVILLIGSVVLFYPFPTTSHFEINDSVLFQYYRSGGFAGVTDTITVYKDGSFEYKGRTKVFESNIPESDLQAAKEFIENKEYKRERESLAKKISAPIIYDGMYTVFMINRNGNTIVIERDPVLGGIIQFIDQQTGLYPPAPVRDMFLEKAKEYSESQGATMTVCFKDTTYYKVTGSGGFTASSYYYTSTGEFLGESYASDIIGESIPPPIDLSEYNCRIALKSKPTE